MVKDSIHHNGTIGEKAVQLMPIYVTYDTRRGFPAPLLSHCHNLQPPIKWYDSASYLFPVNKAYVWANVFWEWILHHTDLNNGANDFVAKDCDSLLWINIAASPSRASPVRGTTSPNLSQGTGQMHLFSSLQTVLNTADIVKGLNKPNQAVLKWITEPQTGLGWKGLSPCSNSPAVVRDTFQ